jgi:hypothetical protein
MMSCTCGALHSDTGMKDHTTQHIPARIHSCHCLVVNLKVP